MTLKREFTIIKGFNNNVVLVYDRTKEKECVLLGKGIGFGMVKGQDIEDKDRIERIYYLDDEESKTKLKTLYRNVDSQLVGATEEAILYISRNKGRELDENIHITLLDHLAFTIERLNNNIIIANPFLYETKILYEDEFKLAEDVLEIINDRMNISLPESEVGFIAMHIHAALHNEKNTSVATNAYIMQDMISVIEKELNISLDKESIDYMRLLTHLRFALDRINKNITIENILLDSIKERLKDAYIIAEKLAAYVKENYNLVMPEEEIGYVAIHIGKMIIREK